MHRLIGIGLVGTGHMGKRHAVAMQAVEVTATLDTVLLPRGETLAATSGARAIATARALDFARSPDDWSVLVEEGAIGDTAWLRAEHSEDFCADAEAPATWRTMGRANSTLVDLAPHVINATAVLAGLIESPVVDVETVHRTRSATGGSGVRAVTDDDQARLPCRCASTVTGHVRISHIATEHKTGYAYEIIGTRCAARFDREDQHTRWLDTADGPEAACGFCKNMTSPAHPDYRPQGALPRHRLPGSADHRGGAPIDGVGAPDDTGRDPRRRLTRSSRAVARRSVRAHTPPRAAATAIRGVFDSDDIERTMAGSDGKRPGRMSGSETGALNGASSIETTVAVGRVWRGGDHRKTSVTGDAIAVVSHTAL